MCLITLIGKYFLALKVKEFNFEGKIGGPASQGALRCCFIFVYSFVVITMYLLSRQHPLLGTKYFKDSQRQLLYDSKFVDMKTIKYISMRQLTQIFLQCYLLRISHKSIKTSILNKFSNTVNLNIVIECPLCPTHSFRCWGGSNGKCRQSCCF